MKFNLKTKLLLALCVAFSLSINAQRKNVLLIISDDFNYWLPEIGYYPHAKTPNLSALANKGVLFTDAQNSSPVCNPSRNAFMSGVRPSTSGISANADGYIRSKAGFAKALTMNQYFTQQGYHTVAGGKIYHPGKMGGSNTDPNNWSELYTGGSGASGGTAYKWSVGGGSPISWSASTGNINNNNDTKLANHFANRITNYNKNKPFFFAVGLFRPHLPWNCPKQFYDQYNLNNMDIPSCYKAGDGTVSSEHSTITNNNRWDDAIRAYLANLSYADYNAGILLDALENSQFADNTIVVFTGDHGWHLGEKRRWKKAATWEQANHTTFIIYDPSAAGNGTKCHKVVSLQDMYPTLVELAGLPSTNKIEGVSLAPLVNNPNLNSWDKPVMITYRGTHCIKTNQYKFIDEGGGSKLYDVVNDPCEFNNLYNKPGYNSVVNQMRNQIDDFIAIGNQVKQNINGGGGDNQSPTKPGNITTSGITQNKIDLSWGASTDNVAVTSYQVQVNGVTYGNPSNNSISVTGLACATSYDFRVRAKDAAGNNSAWSNTKTASTAACSSEQTPFAANVVPGTIEAEDYDNGGQGVAYSDADAAMKGNATSYRGTSDGVDLDDKNGTICIGWCEANEWTEYTIDVQQAGTYTINYSFSTNANTIAKGFSFAIDGSSVGSVSIAGNDPINSVGNTVFETRELGTVTLSAGEHILRWTANSKAICFDAVEFVLENGNQDTEAPTTPGAVTFSNISETSVNVNWGASTDNVGVTGYEVFLNNVKHTVATGTSATISGLTCNTSYAFKVRATDAAGNLSAFNTEQSVTTSACSPQGINDIIDLTAEATACDQIVLNWTDNSTGESGFRVRRKVLGAATFTTLGDVAANAETYTDNAVTENVTYVYQVRPLDNGVAAGISNNPEVTTPACNSGDNVAPTVPSGLSASNITETSVSLSWNASSDNVGVAGYKVFQDGSQVANVSGTSATISGLSCDVTYSFTVSAYDAAANESAQSGVEVVTTSACSVNDYIHIGHVASGNRLGATPGMVDTRSASNTGVNVQWEQVATDGGYFYLVNVGTGEKLNAPTKRTINMVSASVTANSAQWQLESISGNQFRIQSREYGKYFHIAADGSSDISIKWNTNLVGTVWTIEDVAKSAVNNYESVASVKAYPNPTSGNITVDFEGFENPSVQILDLSGRIVMNVESFNNGSMLYTESLNSGQFLIRVSDANNTIVERLIIK